MTYAYNPKLLWVDLSKRKYTVKDIPLEDLRLYIGGRGINIKILYEYISPKIDAFDPENIIVFGTGPLVGTLAPGACRTRISTLSPLTGFVGDSSIGGHWGPELKYAGYDQVVVSGRSSSPVYVFIRNGECRFEDAGGVWGKNTRDASTIIKDEIRERDAQVLCIGPAGENLVRYSCVVGDGYSVAGRTGIGAVMGSKNLKAIVVRGTGGVEVADPDAFMSEALLAHSRVKSHPQFKSLSKIGLMRGMLLGYHGEDELRSLNPRSFLDEYVYKRKTCFGCSAHCMYYYVVTDGPESGCFSGNFPANPLIEWGSKLRVRDWPQMLRLTELSTEYGLDVDGVGSTIYYAVELSEAGMLRDMLGVEVDYDDFNHYVELLELITFRRGIGDLLAEGSKRMAKHFGGNAPQYLREIKGLELMPGQLPHYYNALAHAVSGRGGCHTRSQCFVAVRYLSPEEAEEMSGTRKALEPRETEGKAKILIYYEDLLAIGDSLGVCNFLTGESCSAMDFKSLSKLYNASTGLKIKPSYLRECGKRIIDLERQFNIRQGLKAEDDVVPPRLVSEDLKEHDIIEKSLRKMQYDYYDLRGWNEEGIPIKI